MTGRSDDAQAQLQEDAADAEALALIAPADRLSPGIYLVATPIGNARDITLRALDVLRSAEILAAEDTRRLRHLLAIHGVPVGGRRVLAHHDHNAQASGAELVSMAATKAVAYASDAGTPLISDPGFELVRQAREQGVAIHAIPGASAVLTALSIANLPTDRFQFVGFSPTSAGPRRKWLAPLTEAQLTTVFFESPRRVKETFKELLEICPDRDTVICRELTKRFEETISGTVRDVVERIPDDGLKGEVVVLLAPAAPRQATDEDICAALAERLDRMSVKDAAAEVAVMFDVSRRRAYQLAMELKT